MMKLVNLMPHAVVLRMANGEEISVKPLGTVARVMSKPGAPKEVAGFPVPVFSPDVVGEIDGLPDPQEGVCYLVSAPVGAVVQRADVFTLGTGPDDEAIRNDKGQVVAVTRIKATI